MNGWTLICPVCREELPERGNRRVRIPWLSGRLKLVHDACAPLVVAQGVLESPPVTPTDPVQLVRMRRVARLLGPSPASPLAGVSVARLAQLFRREEEGRELVHQPRVSVRRLADLLAGLEHVQVAHATQQRGDRGLLGGDELFDDRLQLAQLAHGSESCAPARTGAA